MAYVCRSFAWFLCMKCYKFFGPNTVCALFTSKEYTMCVVEYESLRSVVTGGIAANWKYGWLLLQHTRASKIKTLYVLKIRTGYHLTGSKS